MPPPIYVRFIHLAGLPEGTLDVWLERLPQGQREGLLRYHQPIDRLRGAAGKLLLQELLQELGYGPNVLDQLRTDDYHRPFIDSTIDFNITHSGQLVALALTQNGRIGIDVEEIHELNIDDYENFFHPQELQSMRDHARPMDLFFELWTQKEAVMKANGKGMHLPIHDIHLNGRHARCEDQDWTLLPLRLHPGYAAHLAVKENAEIQGSEWVRMGPHGSALGLRPRKDI